MEYVPIAFDCLPLRSVGRLDIPLDASPAFRARCERIKAALERHGSHNSYYLYNARAEYHLTNRDEVGLLRFEFEGTVLTDPTDQHTVHADLDIRLVAETCDWLTEPVVQWMHDTVRRAVMVEFDRYIEAGDLTRTKQRLERLDKEIDQHGGYLGLGL